MEGTITQNKNNTLQILRGLAIIAVLIHHSISRINEEGILHSIDDIIICFHMPAFFIIAGYLYQKKMSKYENMGKAEFLFSKAKHLLVPYAFWTILLWLGVQAANMTGSSVSQIMKSIDFGPMSVKDLIIGLFTYEKYYTEHLWFLYVLFMYFLIHSFLGKAGRSAVCLIIGAAGGFLTLFLQMPNIIDRFLLWFVFFAFGRYIANKKSMEEWIENKAYSCFGYILTGFIFLSAVRILLSF
ncbi:MAG: acyltransferase family protein [Eubacterium sp.]|nr:acyltransferase family protein [Eubacterium sp.]